MPTEGQDTAKPSPRDPLARHIGVARVAIAWEQLWPALWPAASVGGGFFALALFDVLPHLPSWAHAIVLALIAGLFGWTLWRIRHLFTLPETAAGRRRLELASGLQHRPLFALRDDLSGGANDPLSRSLWQAHRARVLAALKSVRIGWPSPGLPSRDPLALRAALVLLLVVGVAAAGGEAWKRIGRAVTPGVAAAALPAGALDLWITPPSYTGQPPLLPKAEPGKANSIAVPVGSALLAQITGGRGDPKLLIDKTETAFQPVAGANNTTGSTSQRSWRVGATIDGGTRLTIDQGGTILGDWTLKVVPDLVPTIEFATAPSRSRRAALRLDYQAADDHGLAAVSAAIRRTGEVPEGAPGEPIDLALTLPSQRAKEASGSSYHDLTSHPWAGLPVTIQLKATDAIGQTGSSEAFATILPERVFQHPVARAIVEQRKALVSDPASRPVISRALSAIAGIPQHYFDDVVVYLGLTMASARLMRDQTAVGNDAVQALLWDLALRIEDGKLSLAERELRALQQRLQDALANNATDEEIERLIKELQEAINRYLQAMLENMQRNPEQMRQPMDRNAMRMEMRDLQKMLDQARQLARTGARDAARELLARLQDMLENLRAGQPMMGQQQGGGEAQQMMQNLQDLIQRQQNLLDRTFRRSQQGRPGQRGQQGQRGQPGQQGQQGQQGEGEMDGDGAADSAEQAELRRQLGELMRQLGEMMGNIPGGLGRAERSMRDSGDALKRGAPGRAVRPQMDALDQMRAAGRDLAQQMMEQFGQGEGEGEGMEDGIEQAQNRDPAGRPTNGLGGLDGRDVNIPEASDVQRSREILDELLRRAGERFRPIIERDYIDRLLKRF